MRSVRNVPGPRRPGAPRSVRWLHRPPADSDGWGTIEIRLGRAVTTYRCRVIPTDFGPEHRGFEPISLTCAGSIAVQPRVDQAPACYC
jgi:hypothetical protein